MPASRLAHYEIVESIGAGGMGEVHRARDTKLGRDVALKLLPLDFANDPDRVARFRREAQLLASLQHAHVASIYGLEEADGQSFLVMELAEGEDLARRLQKGALPVEEAIHIARQIAEALEEAHEKGIVHRDLKPANVVVSGEGMVKVLDFGLAKAYSPEEASGGQTDVMNSPTLSPSFTNAGMILGTAAYMSPEQARGKTVDRRADIWAFGVVLYEMLTASQLFGGETVSDSLAAVLRAEPDWDALPEDCPPALRELMRRCLQRDPRERLRDIGEARYFLSSYEKDPSSATMVSGILDLADLPLATAPSGGGNARLAWIAALILFVLGTGLGWKVLATPEPAPVIHAMIPPPPEGAFHLASNAPGAPILAPDGHAVAFSARMSEGGVALFVRRLDSAAAVQISGSEDAAYPFWSADSQYLAFFADQKLKKVALSGGPPITLCPADNGKGGSWNDQGVIIFAPSHAASIHRVPETGGTPEPITDLEADEDHNSHRHPFFLPDQKQFLYLARSSSSGNSHHIYAGSLEGGEATQLTDSEVAAEFAQGHLLFVRERVLLASPFDPGSLQLAQTTIPLVEDVLIISSGAARGSFSTSENGMLVYQTAAGRDDRVMEWFDQEGQSQGEFGDAGQYFRPRISPDGERVAVEVFDPLKSETDIWIVEIASGIPMRFTFAEGDEGEGVWSPDGSYLYYYATAENGTYLVRKALEGTTEAEELLREEDVNLSPSDITKDGRWIIYHRASSAGEVHSWAYPLDGSGDAVQLTPEMDAIFGGGKVSPDGRWLAYHTNEGGEWGVYVIPFPDGGRKYLTCRDQSVYPSWSPDGTTLYFVDVTGSIRSVSVDGSGRSFRVGAEQELFRGPTPSGTGLHYDFHPMDGTVLMCAEEDIRDETAFLEYVSSWPRGLMR